jgi:hypothetical protein
MNRRGGGCLGILSGLALLIIVLLLLGAFTDYGLGIGVTEAIKTETSNVPTTGAPTLDVENQIGKITIQPSSDNTLSYTVDKHGWSFTSSTAQASADRMKFTVTQSGNTVTMKGEQPAGLLRFNIGNQNTIDVTVNVPHGSIVKVIATVGQAIITNPDGSLDVTANAGSIEVTGARLGGPLNLHANAGEIKFSGALAAGSSANTVLANVGSVTMNLDPSAKYNLNVKADVGSVDTDFSVPNGVQRAGTGATLIGTTNEGGAAAIPLQVTANTGSVKILKLKP